MPQPNNRNNIYGVVIDVGGGFNYYIQSTKH